MGDDPNMVDQIFSVGVLAFILAIVILLKDIIDGGTFSPSERRSALLGFGLAGLLVLSALTMSMVSTDTVNPELYDDAFQIDYSGTSGASYTQLANDVVFGSAPSTPSSDVFSVKWNMTTWDLDIMERFRGIQLNFSQSGIGAVYLKYGQTTIFSTINDPEVIQRSSNHINVNLTSVQNMLITTQLDYSTSNYVYLYIYYDTNWDHTKSTSIDVTLTESNESELANFLIWAVMSFALYIPLLIYLDAFNNIRRFVNDPFGRNSGNSRRRRYTKMRR